MELIRSSGALRIQNATTTFPSWKLYENPFYYSQQHQNQHQHQRHHQHHRCRPQLPLSASKIAVSLWGLSFFKPAVMDSEVDNVRAQVAELKAELELERKVRKKVESLNKRLTKELSEERKGRQVMERICQELVEEIASDKEEIRRMKREIEEEKKMLRVAEVLREERVQMKLAEAKILFEEKLLELSSKGVSVDTSTAKVELKNHTGEGALTATTTDSVTINDSKTMGLDLCGNSNSTENSGVVRSTTNHRRASPEAENPHIKRGIKGFVEFPKVVRAIGSRGRHHLGSKLECQRSQLRLLY
ncbi:PREDICTED: protein BRANCHLESS TRICHOME-like [Nelumbo nucifera]|nr:PREDICTED: protein BRANCHLESS TRICHOME-like [Nelumbo nucifera]